MSGTSDESQPASCLAPWIWTSANAAAATGFVMISMNQPYLVTVAPAIGKEQTGVSLVGSF